MMRRALVAEQGQPVGRGAGGVLVVEVLGGGAEHDVAVDGRRHQDALAERRGHRQQDVADQVAGELVEDDELAAARGDGELVVAEPPVDLVGVQSGGVDQVAGAQRAAAGGDFVMAGVPLGGDAPDACS